MFVDTPTQISAQSISAVLVSHVWHPCGGQNNSDAPLLAFSWSRSWSRPRAVSQS
ncbi:hypothetical protein J3F83DRAFT_720452 [Trichoderma novae-zelandiae]